MADRFDFFFRQKVTEAELDGAFDALEAADRALSVDLDLVGVVQNAQVTEKSGTPDLTVDIAGSSVVYDKLGQRIAWGAAQNVDVSVDESSVSTAVATPGNEKIVSVFAVFERVLTDPRVDGNSLTVFFDVAEGFSFVVRQGAESASPATPPSLDAEHILLADITRTNGQTQIFDADIDLLDRREDAFVLSTASLDVRAGTPEAATQGVLQELENHIQGVSNAHSASAVDYAGGPTWADGTTNPAATVEAQLDKILADLAATTGALKVGIDLATTMADGTLVVGTNIDAALENFLGALGGANGTLKVGGAAYTGTGTSLTAGTLQAQLRELADELGGLATANTWSNTNTFSSASALAFTSGSDTTFDFSSGTDWEVNMVNGNVRFDLQQVGTTFEVRDGTNVALGFARGATSHTLTMGAANVGVANAYTQAPHVLKTGSVATGSDEAIGLAIGPGSSDNAGGADGSFLRLDVPGTGSAGGRYGVLGMNFNGNEGADQRRTYIPTLTYILESGDSAQQLDVSPGGTQELAAQLTENGVMDVEAIVLARGDNAGGSTSQYGRFVRRATIERTSGIYALIGSVETVGTDRHNFDDSSGPTLDVTIVSTTSGPRIQVTAPTAVSGDDAMWWGLMIVTALGHIDTPDVP